MAEQERFFAREIKGSMDQLGFKRPVKFPEGVNDLDDDHVFANLGIPHPAKWHVYFNDFDRYVAAEWTITETGDQTQALTDGAGGLLLLTNAGSDDNNGWLQKVGESFTFAAGKQTYFEARLKVSNATESDFVMGLQITDTTPLDVSDGVFFQKDDGDANLDFHVEKDDTPSSATALAVVANDTFLTMGFWYNGANRVWYHTNGVARGWLAVTNLPTEDLTVSFGIQNGDGNARSMTIDYILVAQETARV